tara:strand:+ start:98 stop:589 length:492 start_codon:yes stop_codon:yes gene_type:complete
MDQRSDAPRKKSTPISQLPDVQQPKQEPKAPVQPQQKRNVESDNELVQRVLTSMQEPSQVNIQEKAPSPPQHNVPQVKLDEINNDTKKEEDTFTNKLLKEGKEPLIIAALAYLSNQQFVTDFIKKYVPKIVEAESNNVTPLGFIIKALLIGVLFYIIKKYLLK